MMVDMMGLSRHVAIPLLLVMLMLVVVVVVVVMMMIWNCYRCCIAGRVMSKRGYSGDTILAVGVG